MLNHKKLSAKVCSVALTLAMVFTAMMPTAAFAGETPPSVKVTPAGPLKVEYDDSLKLSATVLGGVKYQWYYTDSGTAAPMTDSKASGTGNDTSEYSEKIALDADTTKHYYCTIKGESTANNEVASNVVEVTVSKSKWKPSTIEKSAEAGGGDVSVTLDAPKEGATYGNVVIDDPSKLLTNTTIAKPTGENSYKVGMSTKEMTRGDKDIVATVTIPSTGAKNYEDYPVVIKVTLPKLAYKLNVTGGGERTYGTEMTLTASTADGDDPDIVTYQWYRHKDGESVALEKDLIPDAVASTYTIKANAIPAGDVYDYYCIMKGEKLAPNGVQSEPATVTTNQGTISQVDVSAEAKAAGGSVTVPLGKPHGDETGYDVEVAKSTISGTASRMIDKDSINVTENQGEYILTFVTNPTDLGSDSNAIITLPSTGSKNYKSYNTVITVTPKEQALKATDEASLTNAFTTIGQNGTIKLIADIALTSPVSFISTGHGVVALDLNGYKLSGAASSATTGLIDLTSTKGTGLKIVNGNSKVVSKITGATSGYTIRNSGEGSLDISGDVTIEAATGMVAAIGNDKGTVTISGAAKVNGAAVKAVANTGAGTVTISGGEVSSTSATVETISNTGAGTITVSGGKVTSAASAITNTAGKVEVSGGVVSSTSTTLETISNTGTGSITVTGKEGSSTSPTLKTLGNTGTGGTTVPSGTANGKVIGKVAAQTTGTIKATDGNVIITKYGVVQNTAEGGYAVYYKAPAIADIDTTSVTGKTDRVPADIVINNENKLTIGTAAPKTLEKILNGINTLPTGANEPSINWWKKGSKPSDSWGANPIDLTKESVFQVGQLYKTVYVYTAKDGYQFNVAGLTDDTDNVEVTSAANLTTGGKTVELSANKDTLTVTLVWKATVKIPALTGQKADAFVKSGAVVTGAWQLPALSGGRTYTGTATVGTPNDLTLTALSVSSDGLLKFTEGSDTLSHTSNVTVPITGGANYEDYNMTVTVTATQKEPVAIAVDASSLNQVYNGKAVTDPTSLTVTKYAGGKVAIVDTIKATDCDFTYFKNSGSTTEPQKGTSVASNEVKLAGEYIVIATIKDANTEYAGTSTPKDGAFTISKAPITITIKDQTIPEGTDLTIHPELTLDKDYTVEGVVSGEELSVTPAFAYDPATGKAQVGDAVKIVLSNKNAVAPDTGNYDVTCEPGNVIVSSSSPQPPTPPVSGKYTVTIKGGYNAEGARNYDPGETVTLIAGSRSGYSFSSWSVDGVTVENLTSNTITFLMPEHNVTATINWSYNGGGSGGGGGGGSHGGGGGSSSGSSTPSTTPSVPSAPSAPSKPAGGTASFGDIASHWAKQDIEFVAERGLMSGTGNGQFSPDENMTRGMFVTTLGRLAGVNTSSYNTDKFSDVQADAYYAAYVNWAAEKGIVSGTSATSFSPDQPVSRQEMAVMMSNYSKAMGEKLPETHPAAPFTDSSTIASWATGAVQQMEMAGIISGRDTGAFDSTGTATRAEVASVLHRFVEAIGK